MSMSLAQMSRLHTIKNEIEIIQNLNQDEKRYAVSFIDNALTTNDGYQAFKTIKEWHIGGIDQVIKYIIETRYE